MIMYFFKKMRQNTNVEVNSTLVKSKVLIAAPPETFFLVPEICFEELQRVIVPFLSIDHLTLSIQFRWL